MPLETIARSTPVRGKCPLCGAPLEDPNACNRCDWVQGYGHAGPGMRRNPHDTMAAVLSLFWPGLGHLYKGQKAWALGGAALGVLCFLWAITFLMFGGFLVFPACWAFFAIDAYFRKDLKHPAPATA